MRVKRFFASDIRKAFNQVRDEFGKDAVILSHKEQENGVEVVAGLEEKKKATGDLHPVGMEWIEDPLLVDLKQQITAIKDLLHDRLADLIYRDKHAKHPLETSLYTQLRQWGFSERVIHMVIGAIPPVEQLQVGLSHAKNWIQHRISVVDNPLPYAGGIVAVWGHSGAGKTTAVLKMAMQLAIAHTARDILFLSTDSQKISGLDPLDHCARIMDCPVKNIHSEKKLRDIWDGFSDKKFIFIDTPSVTPEEMAQGTQKRLFEAIREISPQPVHHLLVLDATTLYENNTAYYARYRDLGITMALITKMDETQRIGDALSVLIENQIPLAFLGVGKKIPEHLIPANMQWVVKKFLKTGPAPASHQPMGGRTIALAEDGVVCIKN